MSPEQENSRWYLETEVGSIYTTVYINSTLIPKLNVEVITNTLKWHRYVIKLSQSEVENIKPILITENGYVTIKYEIK